MKEAFNPQEIQIEGDQIDKATNEDAEMQLMKSLDPEQIAKRNRLVLENIGLVYEVLHKNFGQIPESLKKDLVQEGLRGLMIAAARFDETRGFQFSTYAVWNIKGPMMRAINTNCRISDIRIPVNHHEKHRRIEKIRSVYNVLLGCEPTSEEIGIEIDMSAEDIERFLESKEAMKTLLLDAPVGQSDREDCGQLYNIIPDGSPLTEDTLGEIDHLSKGISVIYGILEKMDRHQQIILALRFGLVDYIKKTGLLKFRHQMFAVKGKDKVFLLNEDQIEPGMTLKEIGDIFGLSRERIRQIEKNAKDLIIIRLKKDWSD